MEPVDIVMLTHNRLDYLVQTVEALRRRTPEPFRLTVVDNASASDVRNWLAEHRSWFDQVILQAENEHIAGFQRGIDATTSDPFVLAEPDLIVPELQPSWLARMRGLLDRRSDFGLVAMGLDTANRPSVLGPEAIPEDTVVDGELVEGNVGIWFQMIRRDALRVPYVKDSLACAAIRDAGYRVGWSPGIRAFHLGWDDYRNHPLHLASKNELASPYPDYREVELLSRPPTFGELARAALTAAEIRARDVPESSVLELAWGEPVVGPVYEEATVLASPRLPVPLPDRAAGAVVVVEPPGALAARALAEATRLAASVVVVVAPLETFGGRTAGELAPPGWSGYERPAAGTMPLELARSGDELPLMATHLRYTTLEHRDAWLRFFAAGAIPPESERRLFVLRAEDPPPVPERVVAGDLERWRPEPRGSAGPPPPSLGGRLRGAVARRTPAAARRFLRRGGG